jgi:hypothetical protein
MTDVRENGATLRRHNSTWRRLFDPSFRLATAILPFAMTATIDATMARVCHWPCSSAAVMAGGSDASVPSVAEDIDQRDATFAASLDRTLPGAIAHHAAGLGYSLTYKSNLAVRRHAVAVNFLDETRDGAATADRKLHVSGGTPSSNASFYVDGGQIIGPDGQPFKAHGIDILESTLGSVVRDASGGALLKNFPGTNMVRIAMESGYHSYNAPSFVNAVGWLTAKGIVVEIGNYNNNESVATGQALTDELNWYVALAGKYENNPYVWFSTDNEPSDRKTYNGATTAEQLAVYNAIRGTGSTAMIGIEDTFATLDPDNYAHMTNVHWDSHYYNWVIGHSTDLAKNEAAIASRNTILNALFKDADGTIPIICGEFGNSTDGRNIDPGGAQAVQAVLNVSPSYSGWTAWLYYWPDTPTMGDQLTYQSTGRLTAYGQQIADALKRPSPQPAAPASLPGTHPRASPLPR